MKQVDLEKSVYLRLLVYGDSGSGKTYLAGTSMECEDTCPALVLSARGQPVTLRYFDPPPLVLNVESMKDFNAPYQWLSRGGGWKRGSNGQPPAPAPPPTSSSSAFGQIANEYLKKYGFKWFKTVIVDSITHTQRLSLNAITGSLDTMPGDMPKAAQIQHWGSTLRQVVNLTDKYFQLPMHVIMTALTKWVILEDMGYPLYGPYLWGQAAMEVPSHAEIVARLVNLTSVQQQKLTVLSKAVPEEFASAFNVLMLSGGRNFFAKWQGVLAPPEFMLGPTISKLIEVLKR